MLRLQVSPFRISTNPKLFNMESNIELQLDCQNKDLLETTYLKLPNVAQLIQRCTNSLDRAQRSRINCRSNVLSWAQIECCCRADTYFSIFEYQMAGDIKRSDSAGSDGVKLAKLLEWIILELFFRRIFKTNY